MTSRSPLDPRTLEQLSAYLDGTLTEKETAALTARLATDADLVRALEELRFVRDALRKLPPLRSPRPLTLTPAMVGRQPQRVDRGGWTMAFGSALAGLAFLLLISSNLLGGRQTSLSAMPAAEVQPVMMQAAPAETAVADSTMRNQAPAATAPAATQPPASAETAAGAATSEPMASKAAVAETATPAAVGGQPPSAETPTPEVAAPLMLQATAMPIPETEIPPLPFTASGGGPANQPEPPSVDYWPLVIPVVESFLALASLLLGLLAWRRLRRRR
jgi:anti-sigma factor RsiW